MLIGANLHKIRFTAEENPLDMYKSCISKIVGNPPNKDCFLKKCDSYPSMKNFKDAIQVVLEEEFIEKITYKQWITFDRCSLETITKSTDDFAQDFGDK